MSLTKICVYTTMACFLAFALGIFAGVKYVAPIFAERQYVEKIIEKPAEIKETVRHEVETVVQYVPKETIIYKDSATGEQTARKEDTDVETNIGQTAVNVKVNGQPYSFSLLQNEKQKFEDGKLVINQTSEVGFDLVVKPQIIDNTKHGGIDLIAGKYSGIGIKHKRFGIDVTVNVNDRHDMMLQGRWTLKQW